MNWIDRFCDTVGGAVISPPDYVWWAGVSAVSAMMGRLVHTHTFVDTAHDHLYGNLFTLLVGPPGSGKTKAITEARSIIRALGVNVGPDDTNGDRLHETLKTDPENPNPSPGTLALFLDEFDTIIHGGVSRPAKLLLCHLYDCRTDTLTRSTYSHGEQELDNLCLTMVAGCTPAHLHSAFMPLEWQEGLPSRLVMVYGEKPDFRTDYRRGSMEMLMKHAEEIMMFIACHTRIGWEKNALEAYTEWCKTNWNAAMPHALLGGYVARRPLTLAKLSFVLAVANQSSRITMEHFSLALARLLNVESSLDKCLALAGGNETKDVERFIIDWMRTKRQVNEWEIRRMLGMRVSHNLIEAILNELINQKHLVAVPPRVSPNRIFQGGS